MEVTMANADKRHDHLNEDEAELLRQLRGVRREQRLRGLPGWGKQTEQRAARRRFGCRHYGIMAVHHYSDDYPGLLGCLEVTAYVQRWDPYPFILLNLALSFQAAYAAPFIMMSQNRQQDIDRADAAADYQINIKAELEIELLHDKLDALREKEVLALTEAVRFLSSQLVKSDDAAPMGGGPAPEH